mmetsp:Transcript_113770/g.332286  ORF Transcript_113770/g.332286 Transcript_113770/m.332286 type:complete len:211 (+) Transcript_113770:1769-2401(+)
MHWLLLDIPFELLLHPREHLVVSRPELLVQLLHSIGEQQRLCTERLLDVEHLRDLPVRAPNELLPNLAGFGLEAAQALAELARGLLVLLLEVLNLATEQGHLLGELPLEALDPVLLGAEALMHRLPVDLSSSLDLLLDLGDLWDNFIRQCFHGLSNIVKQGVRHVRELTPCDGEDLLAQRGGLLAEALLADPEQVLEGHVADQAPLLVET